MLTVNNLNFTAQKNNVQINSKQNVPRLSASSQNGVDTVTFKANEKLFIKKLRELCKYDFIEDLAGTVEGLGHDVNPKHPDIVKEFENMKKDQTIPKGLKAWIFEDLPKELGIGGNRRL